LPSSGSKKATTFPNSASKCTQFFTALLRWGWDVIVTKRKSTEKAGVEATLYTSVQLELGLNLGRDTQTMLTDVLVASHSHDHFLPNYFIDYPTIRCNIVQLQTAQKDGSPRARMCKQLRSEVITPAASCDVTPSSQVFLIP
jgi:hypothetical protein